MFLLNPTGRFRVVRRGHEATAFVFGGIWSAKRFAKRMHKRTGFSYKVNHSFTRLAYYRTP